MPCDSAIMTSTIPTNSIIIINIIINSPHTPPHADSSIRSVSAAAASSRRKKEKTGSQTRNFNG